MGKSIWTRIVEFKNSKKLDSRAILQVIVALSTFLAFLFLAIATLSTPLSHSMYFLRSSQAKGVRFGLWGWCLEQDDILGYTWGPQLTPALTRSLVLFPMATITLFFFMISTIPIVVQKGAATKTQQNVCRVLAVWACLFTILSFALGFTTFGTAQRRFEKAGYATSWGPLAPMSLIATMVLVLTCFLLFTKNIVVNIPDDTKEGEEKFILDPEARLTPPAPTRTRQNRTFPHRT